MTHDGPFQLSNGQSHHQEHAQTGHYPGQTSESIYDLHLPLHFSRIDKSPASVEPPQRSHGKVFASQPELLEIGDGGDFLTPLMNTLVEPPTPKSISQPDSIEDSRYSNGPHFGPLVNLTVGDELPVSFLPVGQNTSQEPLSLGTLARPDGANIKADDQAVSATPSAENFKLVYPDLGQAETEMFEYFRDKQSKLMSVSPLNYFRSVFLAFSLRYRVVMYGIIAWAAWHHGGQERLARSYFAKASTLIRREMFNTRSKEEILAALLVLASAKICSGDTTDWRQYLILAGETIHLHGGLMSFMESESVRWLLKNFAYHEILASSSLNMPKLFSANDFEIIFDQPSSQLLPDTLCACCQSIFVVLERINELTRSSRLLLLSSHKAEVGSAVDNRTSSQHTEISELSEKQIENIYLAAHEIEDRTWALQPAHKILQHLSQQDLTLQLALFDVFKLVAVIHLYQSVLRINSSSLSMRVVAHRLHEAIEPLFGTMVEGILIFPLFVLGISSTTSSSRKYIRDRFTGMSERLCARNVSQAFTLVQKVWELDNNGQNHVDWNELVDCEGLHFCFA